MKPVEITHYVETSYGEEPSFIILMSDGKEYISNGCQFTENTEENRAYLIERYDCEEELQDLLEAPGIAWEDLSDGSFMFLGCKELTEPAPTPNLVKGEYMYCTCVLLKWVADTPKLVNGFAMYFECGRIKEPASTPDLLIGSHMYRKCSSLERRATTPKIVSSYWMYSGCPKIK